MKGMCQTCGATAPLEWFLTEPVSRQVLLTAMELPKPVQEQVVHYLTLFRPATGRSLAPKRALRLVVELRELVGKGYVHVQSRPDRDCPARIWAAAMEQMAAGRDRLSLPMPNHNYLRQVAWDLADRDDRASERRTVDAERSGTLVRRPVIPEPEDAPVQRDDFAGIDPRALAMLPESVRKKFDL